MAPGVKHKYVCSACNSMITKLKTLRRHQRICKFEPPSAYHCGSCFDLFSTVQELSNHRNCSGFKTAPALALILHTCKKCFNFVSTAPVIPKHICNPLKPNEEVDDSSEDDGIYGLSQDEDVRRDLSEVSQQGRNNLEKTPASRQFGIEQKNKEVLQSRQDTTGFQCHTPINTYSLSIGLSQEKVTLNDLRQLARITSDGKQVTFNKNKTVTESGKPNLDAKRKRIEQPIELEIEEIEKNKPVLEILRVPKVPTIDKHKPKELCYQNQKDQENLEVKKLENANFKKFKGQLNIQDSNPKMPPEVVILGDENQLDSADNKIHIVIGGNSEKLSLTEDSAKKSATSSYKNINEELFSYSEEVEVLKISEEVGGKLNNLPKIVPALEITLKPTIHSKSKDLHSTSSISGNGTKEMTSSQRKPSNFKQFEELKVAPIDDIELRLKQNNVVIEKKLLPIAKRVNPGEKFEATVHQSLDDRQQILKEPFVKKVVENLSVDQRITALKMAEGILTEVEVSVQEQMTSPIENISSEKTALSVVLRKPSSIDEISVVGTVAMEEEISAVEEILKEKTMPAKEGAQLEKISSTEEFSSEVILEVDTIAINQEVSTIKEISSENMTSEIDAILLEQRTKSVGEVSSEIIPEVETVAVEQEIPFEEIFSGNRVEDSTIQVISEEFIAMEQEITALEEVSEKKTSPVEGEKITALEVASAVNTIVLKQNRPSSERENILLEKLTSTLDKNMFEKNVPSVEISASEVISAVNTIDAEQNISAIEDILSSPLMVGLDSNIFEKNILLGDEIAAFDLSSVGNTMDSELNISAIEEISIDSSAATVDTNVLLQNTLSADEIPAVEVISTETAPVEEALSKMGPSEVYKATIVEALVDVISSLKRNPLPRKDVKPVFNYPINPLYDCEICSRTENDSLSLTAIFKHYHHCSKCDARFLRNTSLVVHNKLFHRTFKYTNKPYIKKRNRAKGSCQICGLVMTKRHLYRHRRNMHSNLQLLCPYCGELVRSDEKLYEHRIRHLGMDCPKCHQHFASRGLRKTHRCPQDSGQSVEKR